MAEQVRCAGPVARGRRYEPRRAAGTLLYSVVLDRLESFLAWTRDRRGAVPRFVEREFRAFLECGIPAHGFLRVRCDECKLDRVVPFSCKGRGFCPSCGGRRMADTAAYLVDRVLPRAPVRQWVLSLPFPLRYRLAYDSELAGEVLRFFVRCVFASYRRRAKRKRAQAPSQCAPPQCGAVTFIQRFGDALNLNLHFHTLAGRRLRGARRQGILSEPALPAAPASGRRRGRARRAPEGV